jgi:hypothetical protein
MGVVEAALKADKAIGVGYQIAYYGQAGESSQIAYGDVPRLGSIGAGE